MANQRVTLADVAAEAGVSMSSVGNVIHGRPHVREAVRLRVLEAVDKLGYRPLAIGRNLRSGRTGVISLAVPHLAQPYFADIAREVVSQMAGQVAGGGRSLLVQQTENDLEREREVADAWNLGTSDGLLFSPSVISDEEIEERRGAMPLVLLGEHSNLDTVDRVGIDSVAVAHLATSHLLEQGCTRLAMIGHKTFGDPSVVSQREQGFLTALRGSGLEPATSVELGSVHDWTRRDGYSAAQRLLSAGADVDGVFCANDLLALGFLAAAQERGLRVPDDVAVVGIDDIEDAEYSTPTLSTVAIDRHWMVQQSLRLLAQRMEDPDRAPTHTSAPFSLRTRRSTARRS